MRTNNLMHWVLAALVALPTAHAGVVISQVLYDPIGTESGGEAVELRNDGSAAVDIGDWVLASEASAADATLPSGAILAPGAAYLVADTGWSSAKDSPAWKDADHEETITLANANSGIALKDVSGVIVDAVGWGDAAEIKAGLFEGTPAAEVAAGKALARGTDTNNNAADFTEADPAFFSGETVQIIANITNSSLPANPAVVLPLGAALDEDDSAEPGVQLKPVAGGTRALHLEAYYNGSTVSASWFGRTVSLTGASGVWTGELPLEYWYAAGAQNIVITADSQNTSIPVIVLEVKAAKLESKTVSLSASPGGTGKGTVSVKNTGNVPVSVSWTGSDLVFGTQKIAYGNLAVSGVTIQPTKSEKIEIKLNVPMTAVPGEYRTMLLMNTG